MTYPPPGGQPPYPGQGGYGQPGPYGHPGQGGYGPPGPQPGGQFPPSGPAPGGHQQGYGHQTPYPQQPGYAQQQPGHPQQGYGQPGPYDGPPKKKRTGLIVGLAVGGVVVLGGLAVGGYFLLAGAGPKPVAEDYLAVMQKYVRSHGTAASIEDYAPLTCARELERMRPQLEPAARDAAVASMSESEKAQAKHMTFTIREVKEQGDKAFVPLRITSPGEPADESLELFLNKEEGEWKVCTHPNAVTP